MYGFYAAFLQQIFCSASQMLPKPLDILRKGLKSLQDKVAVKKDHLLAQLADKKSITSLDEHWPPTTLRIFFVIFSDF